MKKLLMNIAFFTFSLSFIFFPASLGYSADIKYSQPKIKVNKNIIKLNLLTIPKSDDFSFKVVSSNPIGSVCELKTLAAKVKGIAAINGTFFNAYTSNTTKRYPYGILINDSNILRAGKNICFYSDGEFKIGTLNIKIVGAINGSYKWPNNWFAWNINNVYTSKSQSVIYTPKFGKIPDDGSKNIVVRNNVVTNITNKHVSIPPDGYVIHIGPYEKIGSRFHIGDSVEYKAEYTIDGKVIEPSNIVLAVGAGPKLITNGKFDVNFERDGFTEAKIKTMRGARSFIGTKSNGDVIIGTTPASSVKELTYALLKIGVVNAMNLDGGASSSMYYNGKYITKPGRHISNAIVIIKNNTTGVANAK